ncbi:DNA cytosine methyltransferase [Guptibacillus hwajinpoensis]|uniref:DNA cytosine methyltransferase n=1 Tax=Guptibacillus hwajinpoensis TaxID=208199 RepID=UPI0024B33652|nr:DNA cytosine methyltransferase [Pseudalkalibacillus hwajinpoensis]
MEFKKGELFCGPGGLSLGAQRPLIVSNTGEEFKVTHEWANDIDENTLETFKRNISKKNIIPGDVREIDLTSLPDIDALAFGFPCNDYSIVGETKGMDGEYGPLYSYGVKVIELQNPDWFIAENVGGLQSANEGQAFLKILEDMENAGKYGYNLTPHLYKFEEYGIPQARHRIIIVGIRKDKSLEFKVPKPTHVGRSSWKTSKQAIENPPINEDAFNHDFTRHNSKVVEMLAHIPQGGNAWSDEIPEHLRLNVKGAKLSNIYKRLHPDLPAYTVTGSGGGGTHMYHYDNCRALTNRERARLQTFPDDFEFIGGKESVRKQIGMAVPPDAAEIIIEAILKTFAEIEYDWIEPKWKGRVAELLEKKKKKATKSTLEHQIEAELISKQ